MLLYELGTTSTSCNHATVVLIVKTVHEVSDSFLEFILILAIAEHGLNHLTFFVFLLSVHNNDNTICSCFILA